MPPPPPTVRSGAVIGPPSQARAAVIRGWHALASGDLEAAKGAAQRARRLDATHAGPLRLGAAVARAEGDAAAAARLLEEALAMEPGCTACRADRARETCADGDVAAAIAAGAHPATVFASSEPMPGAQTLAAWRSRADLDGQELARRGRALLRAGHFDAARSDLLAAAEAGVTDSATLSALVDIGERSHALWAAGRAANRRPSDAQALALWFGLALEHGTDAEMLSAAQALGALPATLLGASAGGSALAVLRSGRAVPGLPYEAALALLAQMPAGTGPAWLDGRGVPETARGLQLWLLAADAVGAPSASVEDAVLGSGDAARAEVVVRWRLQSGRLASAIEGVERSLEGPDGLPPPWWPDALDAAGYVEHGRSERSRFSSALGRAARLVRSGSASGLAAVEAIGPSALHLRPLALLHAGRPCDAVAAFVTLRFQSVEPVPGAGAVGYAGASAGCWTADALPVLRAAQAEAPADGRLAHALGRVLLDLGDPAMARRLFAQARRALPKDALLQADIVRLSRATEDRP